jgi:hypothetical protein
MLFMEIERCFSWRLSAAFRGGQATLFMAVSESCFGGRALLYGGFIVDFPPCWLALPFPLCLISFRSPQMLENLFFSFGLHRSTSIIRSVSNKHFFKKYHNATREMDL